MLVGRGDRGTPPVFVARKKYINKVDRHVNVAFGSRTPLPLSTVRIDTNLPHEVNSTFENDQQSPHLANISQTHTMSHTLNVSEPVSCPPHTRIASSATEKELKLKALNPKAFNNLVPQHTWDSTSFPVQEEPHVDNSETDPILIDRCLDLTSKHGQKLQKLNRRREVKIRKRYQGVRHSQKENCSQNKTRETKEFDVNESPPGSPPSGWDNNSNGGSDNFLFEQHFEELRESDSRDILPRCYTIDHSVGDSVNPKEAFHTSFQNRCILGDGDSYFEKISCPTKSLAPVLQDWSPIAKASNNLKANEQKISCDPQKSSLFAENIGEHGIQTSGKHAGGGMDDSARSGHNVLNSKQVQEAGGMLEHNGPFGSTEELWIVHDEASIC